MMARDDPYPARETDRQRGRLKQALMRALEIPSQAVEVVLQTVVSIRAHEVAARLQKVSKRGEHSRELGWNPEHSLLVVTNVDSTCCGDKCCAINN